MKIYDLHSHSTASDGLLAPRDLVARAQTFGVDVLALTDHDTVEGLAEASAAANDVGMGFVPGVEISATWQERTIHVVGLGIDPANGSLLTGLTQMQAIRRERAAEIGRRLEKEGFPDALAGAQRYGNGRNVTRTHFARYMVELGAYKAVADVFRDYLRAGKPGYVKTRWAPLDQAVAWINGAGGQAVIAHPGRYDLTGTKLRALLGDFVDCGGGAIEVIYSGCKPELIRDHGRLAAAFKLRASVGSDFHDPSVPWVELGRLPRLDPSLAPVWELF